MSTRDTQATLPEETTKNRWSGPLMASIVLVAIGVFAWNAVETSTARVHATTEANSVFSAGNVELTQPDTVVELLFDANNLYPGTAIEGCVEVEYLGSIPAEVRLHAQMLGGTGLDEFIDMTVTLAAGDSCETVAAGGSPALYTGTLARFWRTHNSFGQGVAVAEMTSAQTAILHVVASLQDTNDAQGLTTDFSLTIEARP